MRCHGQSLQMTLHTTSNVYDAYTRNGSKGAADNSLMQPQGTSIVAAKLVSYGKYCRIGCGFNLRAIASGVL